MAREVLLLRAMMIATAVALSACSSLPRIGQDGPPTINGVYSFAGCQGEGACLFANWRTVTATPVLAASDPKAAVIGTLAPGEWIHVEQFETRLIPARGVVKTSTETFRAGEIIYALQYEGEGYVTIWRRGAYATLDPEDPVDIAWDERVAPPRDVAGTLGTWVRLRRENGQTGWVRLDLDRDGSDRQFECTGPLAGDADCRG